MHETGYCDFEKEGDAKDYVIVGDYNGCGDYFPRKSAKAIPLHFFSNISAKISTM